MQGAVLGQLQAEPGMSVKDEMCDTEVSHISSLQTSAVQKLNEIDYDVCLQFCEGPR